MEVLFAPSMSYEFDLRPPFPLGCGWTGNEAASAGTSRQTDEGDPNESLSSNRTRWGNPPHCYLFNLTGAQGLRIRGQGSNFTFRSGYITFLGTYKSTRVHVDGFGVDFDPIPNTALLPLGRAQGGNGPPSTRSFLAALAPGHPPLDDPTVGSWLVKYGIAGIQARLGLQGTVPGRVQRGSKEVVPYTVNMPPYTLPPGGDVARKQSSVDGLVMNTELDTGKHDRFAWARTRDGSPVYNLTIESSSQDIMVDENSAVVIDPRIATGFDMYRSDTVVISDVTVWACSNECANSAYTPRVSMLRLQIRRKEGRYYAANSEGCFRWCDE